MGLAVHYRIGGAGPPVLLFHGLGGSLLWWEPNFAPLARQFRVIALDLPGHGGSAKPAIDYTLPFASRFLADFLDALGLAPVALVGHSTGGLVALRFALDHPERVTKLVLVDSPGLGRELHWVLRLLTLPIVGEFLATPRPLTLRPFLKQLFYDPSLVTPELLAQSVEERRQPGAKAAILSAMRSGANLWGLKRRAVLLSELGRVQVPCLILWGEADRILPVAHARAAHHLIPGSRLHIFPKCGHCPPLEKPDEFNRIVADFLAA